jgi:beta-glucosidase
MSAFNAIDGVPASASAHLLDEILRREWGFRGFVVSDWTAVKELIEHGIANDGATAARKAITAGVDMDMESELYLHDLPGEVRVGRLPMAVVDEAVRRVLRVKFALGLFEQPYTDEREPSAALDPADVELARRAAEQSFVLLKNESVLPLGDGIRTIALIGPLADAPRDMLGTWKGRGEERRVVTLRAALADHCGRRGIELVYEKGTETSGGTDAGIAAAVEAARRADVVLLAVGEDAGITGEAASRTRIDLPGLQPELLRAVASTGTPLVLLVFSGRPLALTPYIDHVAAVVQAWHPGIQAGPALLRVLSGEVNFTGRLTVSFPRSVGQLPLYYNHMNTGRPKVDPEEKFVTKYLDEENTPLYPFGYGLSYTRFEYAQPQLSAATLSARAINSGSASVKVIAEVRNAGDRDGVEVVQLYIRQRGTSVSRPVRELKGFRRVALRAGESRRVEFSLGRDELAFWNLEMKHVAEPARVTVWVAKDAYGGGDGVELEITE